MLLDRGLYPKRGRSLCCLTNKVSSPLRKMYHSRIQVTLCDFPMPHFVRTEVVDKVIYSSATGEGSHDEVVIRSCRDNMMCTLYYCPSGNSAIVSMIFHQIVNVIDPCTKPTCGNGAKLIVGYLPDVLVTSRAKVSRQVTDGCLPTIQLANADNLAPFSSTVIRTCQGIKVPRYQLR